MNKQTDRYSSHTLQGCDLTPCQIERVNARLVLDLLDSGGFGRESRGRGRGAGDINGVHAEGRSVF